MDEYRYLHVDKRYGKYVYCSSHPEFKQNPQFKQKKEMYFVHKVAEPATFKDYVHDLQKLR